MSSIYRELAVKIQKEVPIKDVIESRLGKARNGYLCPFHDDHTPGSFHYSTSKNIFKCFSCGEGGGPVKFVEKYDRISHKEAILRISLEYGFIDKGMYEPLSKSAEYAPETIRKPGRKIPEILEKNPELQLHLAYSLVAKHLPINDKDRDYLHGRGIQDDDIKRNHYFSFTGEDITKEIVEDLKSASIDVDILLGIPGFYKENNEMKMVSVKGIGIPLKNCFTQVIGLQIRNTEPSGSRYYYFSSTGMEKGTSCGSIIDVVSRGELTNSCVYITEGHFKADKLAKETGSFVLSLQGVNNISPLQATLDQFDRYHYSIDEIAIAFDSDIVSNPQVLRAAEKLCELLNELRPDIPISFTMWESEYGKGIDDVIDAGHFDLCMSVPQDDFFDMMKENP